jgi:surfactin synthase thioesterase subunit
VRDRRGGVSVRVPGREELVVEEPYESMDDAVEDLAAELDEADLPPYVLYGHCSGGMIAHALARARPHERVGTRGARAEQHPVTGRCGARAVHDTT